MAHRIQRRHRRRSTRRTSRRGGGYSMGAAYVSPGNMVVQPNQQPGGADCLAASRPGELDRVSYGGLPGMRGGRYMSSLPASVLHEAGGIVATPAQAVRIPCESSIPNPLNLHRGGGVAPPVMNVGSSAGMAAYHAPTAGYGNQMTTGSGQPLMLHVPYEAKSCISTGGRRRSMRKHKRKQTHKKKHKTHRRR